MSVQEIIAVVTIAIPFLLFALNSFIDKRINTELSYFRDEMFVELKLKEVQIEQLQDRIKILQVRLGDEPETFIRFLPK